MSTDLQNIGALRNPVPGTTLCEQKAVDAYAAHQALAMLEQGNPSLVDNPAWQELRTWAFDRFLTAFEVAK